MPSVSPKPSVASSDILAEDTITTAQVPTSIQDAAWPLVTVIVPSYRHARYVSGCLDSITATEYSNLEIVIINDASPDNDDEAIRAWLARHPGARVRYILHEQNQGLTKTLNEAIDVASGEYISLLAADDLMLPNGIHDRVQYLLGHPHKLAVFADCHVIDSEGNQVYQSGIEGLFERVGMRKTYLCQDYLIKYEVVFKWAVPGPVFLCHKGLFDVVGKYDETLMVEDWDMYLRAVAAGRLGFLDDYVAQYRLHDDNTVHHHKTRMTKDQEKVRAKNLHLFSGLCRWRLQTECRLEDRYRKLSPGLKKWYLSYVVRVYRKLSSASLPIIYAYFGLRQKLLWALHISPDKQSS